MESNTLIPYNLFFVSNSSKEEMIKLAIEKNPKGIYKSLFMKKVCSNLEDLICTYKEP